jgi:cytochrome c553
MHVVNNNPANVARLPRADWARCLLLLAGMVALSAANCAVFADEPDGAAKAGAQKTAVTVCGTCHGPQGNSTQPKFPRLAGQNAQYLAAQLKAFRAQTRGDPDAIGYMWGMAGQLDDVTVDALSGYYSGQKPQASSAGRDAVMVARGREIYEHGIASQGVPACSSCHGPDAHGLQEFPRLAGQHAQYILKQLASFQSSMRNVAIMHGVAQNLHLADMQSVAAYLESQP